MEIRKSERTSIDRITRQPLIIVLGGQEYAFQPKSIRGAEEWRKKLLASFPGVMEALGQGFDDMGKLVGQIAPDMLVASDKILKLMIEWEPDLDWETIQTDASEEELMEGFWEVLLLAFPLFGFAAKRLPDLIDKATSKMNASNPVK